VFLRFLLEVTPGSIDTVFELITQNSLYRGQEHKFVVNLAKIESIPIDKFISEIVPNADSIEIMLENRHMDNRDGS
jgi:hypothetical protein